MKLLSNLDGADRIVFTPAGRLSSTSVQAAIEELAQEAAGISVGESQPSYGEFWIEETGTSSGEASVSGASKNLMVALAIALG